MFHISYPKILCKILEGLHASMNTYSASSKVRIMLKLHPSNDAINLTALCLYNECLLFHSRGEVTSFEFLQQFQDLCILTSNITFILFKWGGGGWG